MKNYKNIDEYITNFPVTIRELLETIRATINKAAPKAEETIGYGIPTFKLYGNLVHFAGYKNHIGFYPGAAGVSNFKKELSIYKTTKGAIQFPLDKKLPLTLITKIVKFRLEQNTQAFQKKGARTCKNGHTYYKSSDCPVCPICEKAKQPKEEFLYLLSAPARRALENNGIKTIKKLSSLTEKEILKFHGMGPSAIPKLRMALKKEGLIFKK